MRLKIKCGHDTGLKLVRLYVFRKRSKWVALAAKPACRLVNGSLVVAGLIAPFPSDFSVLCQKSDGNTTNATEPISRRFLQVVQTSNLRNTGGLG